MFLIFYFLSAIYFARWIEKRTATRSSRILYPKDATIQRTRRCTRSFRLYVLLYSFVRWIRSLKIQLHSLYLIICGKFAMFYFRFLWTAFILLFILIFFHRLTKYRIFLVLCLYFLVYEIEFLTPDRG